MHHRRILYLYVNVVFPVSSFIPLTKIRRITMAFIASVLHKYVAGKLVDAK